MTGKDCFHCFEQLSHILVSVTWWSLYCSSDVAISVLRVAILQDKVTGATNRPWPRLFRSTRTPCALCTLLDSTEPQDGVGETPLMKRTTTRCLTVGNPSDSLSLSPHQAHLTFSLPPDHPKQLLDAKESLINGAWALRVLIYMLCICVCLVRKFVPEWTEKEKKIVHTF